MKSPNSCLKYFGRPTVVELVSAKLAAGLELRLFKTFLRGPLDSFDIMDHERDPPAAAKEGRFEALKWLFDRMKGDPNYADAKVFKQICASAASGGHLEIL
jgi:hypothetical protein